MKITKPLVLAALVAILGTTACDNENKTNWDTYKDWREYNDSWMAELSAKKNADGTPYYTTVVAPWDPQAFVLLHVYGTPNTQNLKPLFTSTVKINYSVQLANDTLVDKGTGFTTTLNAGNTINGLPLALMQLNVGDSAEVIMPYTQAYGSTGSGSVLPYSDLRFSMRLTDIIAYEIRP